MSILDEHFKQRRVLILGGLGFIGSTLAHRLVRSGAQVQLVDSLIPHHGGNFFNISGIKGDVKVSLTDVRDRDNLAGLVRGQEYVFNLVGQTSHTESMADPYTDLEQNCRAQLAILDTCRGNNPEVKIVFASTRQVYGKPHYLPVDERHPLEPVDINGIHKSAAEQYHSLYNRIYGIRTSILRLTNTYGPRMRIRDARQTFLGAWIRSAVVNEPFEIWGGQQLRDLTYVDDVVEALMLAADNASADGGIFNLAGTSPISLKGLADLLIDINGGGSYSLCAFPEERKRIDIESYYADDNLIRATLGWQPQVPLADGLTRTLSFFRRYCHEYLET